MPFIFAFAPSTFVQKCSNKTRLEKGQDATGQSVGMYGCGARGISQLCGIVVRGAIGLGRGPARPRQCRAWRPVVRVSWLVGIQR